MLTDSAATEAPTTETAAIETETEERPLSIEDAIDAWARADEAKQDTAPVEGTAAEGDAPTEADAEAEATDVQDAAATEAPTEAGQDTQDFDLVLPGRREGDPETTIPLAGLTSEQRERVAQLVNGYERGVRKADLDRRQSELDGIYEALSTDPATFLAAKVDPSIRREIALALLSDFMEGEEWDGLVDEINTMEEDPARREQYRPPPADDTDPEVAAMVDGIHNAVRSLIPEDASDEDADGFENAALAHLVHYTRARQLDALDPAEVPALIGRIARGYGFQAAASSAPAAAAPAPEKIAAAVQHGPKLVQASARKKEVSSIAPSGLGATSASGLQPPPGLNIEQTMDWFAKQK
jgi:hypothetical protein